jgi:tRNA-(ms[2]io[6]A)-hydroxylase
VAEPDLRLAATPAGWLEAVLADFPQFLRDHASCEKKASGMALNVASHYPDRPRLLAAMADLAVEELSHYREVVRAMQARGIQPGADSKDPYIHALNALIRRGSERFLLDRLLVGAIVERRGAERFALVRDALASAACAHHDLHGFYRAITESEHRHWQQFIDLARHECPHLEIDERLAELVAREADIVGRLPFRAALH